MEFSCNYLCIYFTTKLRCVSFGKGRFSALRYKIGCLEDENANLAFQNHCEKLRLEKIYELEEFIEKGKKLEKFNTDQMRNTPYTIKIEPGQIFAQVKFECGLEARELILRKATDPTADIENRNL